MAISRLVRTGSITQEKALGMDKFVSVFIFLGPLAERSQINREGIAEQE